MDSPFGQYSLNMTHAITNLLRIVLSACAVMLAIEYLWSGSFFAAWVYVAISCAFGLLLMLFSRPGRSLEEDAESD